MELDELKILLKEQPVKMHVVKSPDDIALLMVSKTISITAKLMRSLKIEIVACIVFAIPCFAVAIFGAYPSLRIYFGIFGFICLLFLPVLFILHKKTAQFSGSALPVKSNLQQLINLLNEYVKRYFQVTMALIPASLLLSFLLGYNDESLNESSLNSPLFLNFIGNGWKLVIVVAYLIGFGFGMYYVTKWYLKKLYGKYIDQLQQLIKELEE